MTTNEKKNDSNKVSDGSGVAKSRRRLVATLAAGGAGSMLYSLPDGWKRPVVESVVLPAHAQTTAAEEEPERPDLSDGSFSLFAEALVLVPDRDILDYFASTAHADPSVMPFNTVSGCLDLSDGRLSGEIIIGFEGFPCLAEYDLSGGAALNGSVDADDIVAFDLEFVEECGDHTPPATLEFLSISGTAPNRTVRIRLTTAGASETFDCPEGCEG